MPTYGCLTCLLFREKKKCAKQYRREIEGKIQGRYREIIKKIKEYSYRITVKSLQNAVISLQSWEENKVYFREKKKIKNKL